MKLNLRQAKGIKRRVLVVDDEFINREILGNILSETYEVLYAENGREALQVIEDNKNTISIIMLDLLMPEMDGFELLQIRGKSSELKRIPVIVLTSERSAEIRSLKMGASDFIKKPYDMPEIILMRVNRIIELSEDKSLINSVEEDDLTGLYNKEIFFQYAQQYMRHNADRDMDMASLNINRFHLINELYGRSFGQKVIKKIGECLKQFADKASGFGCRSHADVFFLFCPHREDYYDLWKNIQNELNSMSGRFNMVLRIGVYSKIDNNLHIEACADRAKNACDTLRGLFPSGVNYYELEKNNNGSSVTSNHNLHATIAYYDFELYNKELYYERLINDMHTAIDEKQFKIYYQPKYSIKDDIPKLKSAEALIRWQHPEFGMISPGDFIPLFEKNGLINYLDNYVWKEVALQIKLWKDKFGVSIPVSVNVSRLDIYDPDLESKLIKNLEENGLDTSEYMLEITESAYAGNAKQLIKVIKSLRDKGFKIEMDDFGSGYSSLNMLAELPIDVIKLDMQFIKNMHKAEKNLRIIELIVDISKFLGLTMVAEGVEDESQYKILKDLGCDLIQGYFFSKPVPPNYFEKFIEEKVAAEAIR